MFVYMNTEAGGNVFKFRGESDNVESFKALMEDAGHAVFVSPSYVTPEKIKLAAGNKAVKVGV